VGCPFRSATDGNVLLTAINGPGFPGPLFFGRPISAVLSRWLLLAILKTARYFREGMRFNLGWWGFIFQLGIYSLATLALARAHSSCFLRNHPLSTAG
jgi:tellurite resistance protein TehA-like permease